MSKNKHKHNSKDKHHGHGEHKPSKKAHRKKIIFVIAVILMLIGMFAYNQSLEESQPGGVIDSTDPAVNQEGGDNLPVPAAE